MIESIQKVIAIGSSKGVTLPNKAMQRDNIRIGDEVKITVQSVRHASNAEDQQIIDTAKKILKDYQQDFKNLAKR